jgi:hypothetical protein
VTVELSMMEQRYQAVLEVFVVVAAGGRGRRAAQQPSRPRLRAILRTIATRPEHILTKLDADTRALAAVRAQRRGVYISPTLLVPTRSAPS